MNGWQKVISIIAAIAMIAVGIMSLFNPAATLVSVAWMIAILALVSGVLTLVYYFSGAKQYTGSGWLLFEGIVDIIMGVILLFNGFFVATMLPYIFGVWIIFSGIVRIIGAFDCKKLGYGSWWLILILGIIAIGLGLCSMFDPIVGIIAITVLVGLSFIMKGIGFLATIFTLSKFNN